MLLPMEGLILPRLTVIWLALVTLPRLAEAQVNSPPFIASRRCLSGFRSAEHLLEWGSAARDYPKRWAMGFSRLLQVCALRLASDVCLLFHSDSGNPRTLGVGVTTNGPTTIESCTDACFNAGYPLAGAEFATQCFCGLDFAAGSGPANLTDCNMPCAGNSSEFCGGPNRLNVSSLCT